MKMKATAIRTLEIKQFEEKVARHSVDFNDVIRMKFLEQSAKYLGVYVENSPDSLLDERSVN